MENTEQGSSSEQVQNKIHFLEILQIVVGFAIASYQIHKVV